MLLLAYIQAAQQLSSYMYFIERAQAHKYAI